MWVVKLGGSLTRSPRLQDWVTTLAEQGAGKVIIVPGGGPFADLVRDEQARLKFTDDAAHAMAILAMEQFGFLLSGLHPDLRPVATQEDLLSALTSGQVPVWLAYPMTIYDPTLPRNWSVTADSLALWLAITLKAEGLLLVKSAPLPHGRPDLESLSAAELLDGYFPALAREFDGCIRWLNDDEYMHFSAHGKSGQELQGRK